MKNRTIDSTTLLLFALFFLVPVFSWARVVPQQATSDTSGSAKGKYSEEAVVLEDLSCKQIFEDDGTSLQENTARIRVQSDSGLKRFGLLTFSYPSGTGTFDVIYVRARKPDGTVVETPADTFQDMPAQITREAPFYSDLHEKHVAVKGLSVGDVLEYQFRQHTTKPLAPGQFWTEYKFTDEVVVLNERLQISVPRSRSVKVKSGIQPTTREEGGYRVYEWVHSNAKSKDTSDKEEQVRQSWQQAQGKLSLPDVMLSSFTSWEDVGRWYVGLQEERAKATPDIIAKAAELTKESKDDDSRIRTIYSYVSTNYRYIGVAFGIGRYQAHAASDVLANQYGDCKDKHTLLAAMLGAVGIPAYPALISSTREVDEEVPSPGQFDHVITVVPRDSGLIWLDTTSEVGPYRYLVLPLRNKHALVILKDKANLAVTPADLPYEDTQRFHIDAKLNDAGALEGMADLTARGDLEYLLRSAFRNVPMPQWTDLTQKISYGLGFGGEVSNVTASPPQETDLPFRISWKYTRKDFGDWPNRRIVIPAPFLMVGPTDDDLLPSGPSWQGTLSEIQLESEMTLPDGFHPELQPDVHLTKDFALYDSTYEFKDQRLLSHRHMKVLRHEVPASEREQYLQFVKAVQDDYGLFISLSSGTSSAGSSVAKGDPAAMGAALRGLPDSSNSEALKLEDEARKDIENHETSGAVASLYRAVSADPKFTRAWVMLGSLLISQRQIEAGVDAFHKAIDSDPEMLAIPKTLGSMLMAYTEFERATKVWQDLLEGHPDDPVAMRGLGQCLMALKRYKEAAATYEQAVKSLPGEVDLQAQLASAYLRAEEREKAGAAYLKLGDMHPADVELNNAAYTMASDDFKLPLALQFAEQAVRGAEQDSQKLTLSDLNMQGVGKIFTLAAYFDTLGWVNYRMSHFDVAEGYLQASWGLNQDGVVASHLCQLYDRIHKAQTAVQMCSMAINRIQSSSGLELSQANVELETARSNLKRLTTGSKVPSVVDAADMILRERTFKLPHFIMGKTESAEFFVLFASDGKSKTFRVEDTKFISGSDKMKTQGKILKSVDFGVPAPGDVPARFVRRGILGCYQYSGCSFVLLDPETVRSVD